MKTLLAMAFAMIAMNTTAQILPVGEHPMPVAARSDYEVGKDPKNESVVYRGTFSLADMQKEPSFSWLGKGMAEYNPDPKATSYLSEHLRNYELRVFLGTWCEDSQNMIPKLYKVLQGVEIVPLNSVVIIGMDRDKTTKDNYMSLVKEYKITLLPTIVVLNSGGKEVGRIIESTEKSVEADLARIIRDDLRK